MCVTMSDPGAGTSRVGIRALRQNLSVYIQRIHRGERFEVTDRGRSVALLVPLGGLSPLARLVAEGRASMPDGDLLELSPPGAQPSTAASEVLITDRDDRF